VIDSKYIAYRREQLAADNRNLRHQMEASDSHLMELATELERVTDDVSRLQSQLSHNDAINGMHRTNTMSNTEVVSAANSE